jgi:hypothetical protein
MARQRKTAGKAQPATGTEEAATGASAPAASDEYTLALAQARLLLERADDLIGERSHWTRRALARDRHSKSVSVSSERAVRFCVGGALLRAATEQLGLRLAANAREETAAAIVEEIEQLDLVPLGLANRLLARAFEWLLLRPNGVRIREQRSEDGSSQPVLVVPAEEPETGQGRRRREHEEPTKWSAIVFGLNDHSVVKHAHIRSALALAQLFSYAAAQTTPSEKKEGAS